MTKVKIGEIEYVSLSYYAELKGVTLQTVYNWINDNKVKTTKLMGKTLVRL